MSLTSLRSAPPTHLHARPSVEGLEAGRKAARKAQRRRRRSDRIVTTILMLVVAALLGAVGWYGYQFYVEHDNADQVERDRRVAELQRQRAGWTADDVIGELENTPAWNGPGNPTFGVGSGTDGP